MADTLRNTVVVITGGSTGIGRATAHAFSDLGADVVVAGRRPEALAEAAAGRSRVHPHRVDVTDPDGARGLVEHVARRFGRLDVLVNNAGVTGGGSLAGASWPEIENVIATNLLAPIRLTGAALPLLTEANGVIVNVSTSVGQRAWPGSGVYAASKVAVESLTRTWAVELAGAGVRVVAVAPGAVRTPIGTHNGLSPEQVEAVLAWQIDRTPVGRIGTPEEVGGMIVALASPAAGFVTGAILAVDGGAVVG